MKDVILNNLSMNDILNKYGIKVNRGNMFACPFHGDKHPSAKAYQNSYYCFACNKTSDTIGFVQDYFHIGFREAIEKINIDFNLGIDNSFKMDSRKLERIKKQQEYLKRKKQAFEKQKTQKLIELCNYSIQLDKDIANLKKKIKPYNWEEYTETISLLEIEKENLDLEFNEVINRKLEI